MSFVIPEKPLYAKALVILSGGQDSTTCLGYALKAFREVEAIVFTYGQKHSIEVEQASIICSELGVKLHYLEFDALSIIADSALTTDGDVSEKHHRIKDLPASFVPNRNALFITLAHAYAQKIEAGYLVTGVCQTDYSGYPDCRQDFIDAIGYALNIGSQASIAIVTPLMNLNKAETFRMAETTGILDIVIEHSHTCYNGVRDIQHDWGAGCGECPACELRKKGWEEYQSTK